MKRVSMFTALALCAGMTLACGGDDRAEIAEQEPEVIADDDGPTRVVNVTGCLTASGDRFVLTELEQGTADPNASGGSEASRGQSPSQAQPSQAQAGAQSTTESYQLIGQDEQLRGLVGQRVRVTGEADAPRVAEIRESSPPTAASGTSGQQETRPAKPGEPQVSTLQQTRLEVTQLAVTSVTGTGEACVQR